MSFLPKKLSDDGDIVTQHGAWIWSFGGSGVSSVFASVQFAVPPMTSAVLEGEIRGLEMRPGPEDTALQLSRDAREPML